MKEAFLKTAAALVLVTLCGALAFGQAITTGSVTGTVTDPAGGVVAGATVLVRNNDTGAETTMQSSDSGTFSAASLPTGTYTITITSPNFKKAVVQDVKVNVGTASSINIALEVGAVTETVTITGAGGELLQTQSATVGQTITGRQITDLPQSSRDALDLVLLLPGTNTPGSPRTSTVNGLPKGSLNITLDGVNVQDNNLKSAFGGGFFTYVRPRIDAIDEVTVSTSNPGAESSGEGAVQIKFVTRSGGNEFHGSLYEYHRHDTFNAAYWFNNRSGQGVDKLRLNQYGGRVGGPVRIPGLYDGRDKFFFFTNMEEFRLPESLTRQRTILNPLAQTGVFTTTAGQTVNLFTLAAASNCGTAAVPAACTGNTTDPDVVALLGRIRASTSQGSLRTADNNRQEFTFSNQGGQLRRFMAVRFDYNLTDKHHIENTWNYQRFGGKDVDFLNSTDPAFPGFVGGVGGQNSLRWSNSSALRSNLTGSIVNEARLGFQGGNSFFRGNLSPAAYTDQAGFSLTLGAGLTNPQVANSNQRRNSPVKTFTDNVTWVKGTHSINFGGAFSRYNTWTNSINVMVPVITFGVDANDPSARIFTAANLAANAPGVTFSTADITLAQGIYALLTGRVTSVGRNAYLDEEGQELGVNGIYVNRFQMDEWGFYGQDSWRFRPNLTLNFGLRWEVQEPLISLNRAVTYAPESRIFGISAGRGLFNPGPALPGATKTDFRILEPGERPYNTDYNNFLPSVGFAYSPDWKSGILNRFFGSTGQTVLRGGYSIATVREGLAIGTSILSSNPGGVTSASTSTALSGAQFLQPGTLFRDRAALAPPSIDLSPDFPVTGVSTTGANTFEQNLRIGYVQSWTAGIQREITKDMVFEARYVGNRGVKLWRQVNYNEINVIENGFINEFRLAQANLFANNAFRNAAGQATRAGSFAYFGEGSGTVPLPTILAYFRGCAPTAAAPQTCTLNANTPGQYTSALFTNATLTGQLSRTSPNALAFANNVFNNDARFANGVGAGQLPNSFIVNPDYRGGAFVVTNRGRSYYDAMTLELRRRMSKGLLVQANYTWSKSLTNMHASNTDLFVNPPTFRNDRLGRVASSFDITHALKANWIYELPFGRGKKWGSDFSKAGDWAAGGWEWQGTARLQSGTPFQLGNVQLVGMTKEELQNAIEIRKSVHPLTGIDAVLFLPDDIITNTFRAFSTTGSSTTNNGYTQGAPTGRYIAPAGFGNCVQTFGGQCGFANLVLYGPRFFRFDTSIIKRIRFTENTNIEMRAEFLNAINNQNFSIGASGNEVTSVTNFNSTAFGQTTNAYRDISTTNDPGGRVIQFVLRFNF